MLLTWTTLGIHFYFIIWLLYFSVFVFPTKAKPMSRNRFKTRSPSFPLSNSHRASSHDPAASNCCNHSKNKVGLLPLRMQLGNEKIKKSISERERGKRERGREKYILMTEGYRKDAESVQDNNKNILRDTHMKRKKHKKDRKREREREREKERKGERKSYILTIFFFTHSFTY